MSLVGGHLTRWPSMDTVPGLAGRTDASGEGRVVHRGAGGCGTRAGTWVGGTRWVNTGYLARPSLAYPSQTQPSHSLPSLACPSPGLA